MELQLNELQFVSLEKEAEILILKINLCNSFKCIHVNYKCTVNRIFKDIISIHCILVIIFAVFPYSMKIMFPYFHTHIYTHAQILNVQDESIVKRGKEKLDLWTHLCTSRSRFTL